MDSNNVSLKDQTFVTCGFLLDNFPRVLLPQFMQHVSPGEFEKKHAFINQFPFFNAAATADADATAAAAAAAAAAAVVK